MTADQLLAMLAQRHSDDVFVAECKDGPSQTRTHRRLDAWVLRKTWSPITAIGYEIKVDRGDWRRDEKIADYMPLCHLLYVVAPKGIVPVEELPAGVGLMEPVGESGRLQTKRKAARRDIVLPSELMVYVLMCRAKITRETNGYDTTDRNWRTKQLREWVAEKDDRRGLSFVVSQKIQRKFEQQQAALDAAERRNRELEQVEHRIRELGFDPSKPINSWSVTDRLAQFNVAVSDWTLTEMRGTAKRLTTIADSLAKMKAGVVSDETEVA